NRVAGAAKQVAAAVIFLLTFYVISQVFEIKMSMDLKNLFERLLLDIPVHSTMPARYKCGTTKTCPKSHFAFKIARGTPAGPKKCEEDNVSRYNNHLIHYCLVFQEFEVQETCKCSMLKWI
uniref:Uncharacterized protein n=1 Tax=Salvator merianae TaxID=96440 RepID=A0A8D0B0B5_SALMN